MKIHRPVQLILFALLVIAGSNPSWAQQEIIVSAAASLTNAMTEAGKAYEKGHSSVTVVLNFASSGSLVQQMMHGAPVDVFASASQKFMDRAQQEGLLLPNSRKNFAGNQLILACPLDSHIPLHTLQDLLRTDVTRIAVGNPSHVPAGQYAKEALSHSGLWKSLSEKMILAGNVRQIVDYLVRREVDFGLLYATDVVGQAQVKTVMPLPGHRPIVYPVAVLRKAREREEALRFVAFLLSEEGLALLSRFGFSRP